jgi:transposase-like protein
MKATPGEPQLTPAPTACPFCGSSSVTTTSEKVDVSAYWRCKACGEMWNLGRLQTSPSRYNRSPRWK